MRKLALIAIIFMPSLSIASAADTDYRPVTATEAAPLLGYYRQGEEFVRFSFKDGHLYAAGTGQPEIELKERTDGVYEASPNRGEWQFRIEPNGRVTAAILTNHGKTLVLPRLPAEEANRIEAEEAENLRRTTPHDGSEERLRDQIKAISAGMPNYNELGPKLGQSIRDAFASVKTMFEGLGKLQSLTYKQTLADGADVFWATYENGRLEWVISPPDLDGKTQHLAFRPI